MLTRVLTDTIGQCCAFFISDELPGSLKSIWQFRVASVFHGGYSDIYCSKWFHSDFIPKTMFLAPLVPSHGALPERFQPHTPSAPSRRPVASLVVGVAVGSCRWQQRCGVRLRALNALVVGGTGRVGGSTTRWLKKLSLENNLELDLSVGGVAHFFGTKRVVFLLVSFQLRVHIVKWPWKYSRGHRVTGI